MSSAAHSRPTLLGRTRECAAIDGLLDAALQAVSGALVLRGEAGLGKSALLRYAADRADGFTVLEASGVEAEAELDFGGVHGLLRPILTYLPELPEPQRVAVSAALGLSMEASSDRFLVSAGVLSLLAAAAEEQPLLCVIDDAQWLDVPTADALVFAARRLGAEAVVLLFAAREGESRRFEATGLGELVLRGLDRASALELLDRRTEGASAAVRERLLEDAAGNPLALLELPAGLSQQQLAGRAPLSLSIPLSSRLEEAFRRRVARLPTATQTVLQLIAADEAGELAVILSAAGELGLPDDVLDPAEEARLVAVRDGYVVYRHPLVRSAVYESATSAQRRHGHAALAHAYPADQFLDRRVWHQAAAALDPDERLADALEQAAERSRIRGGHGTAATAFERAGQLSGTSSTGGRRLAAAARAAYVGGQVDRAADLVARALPDADRPQRSRLLGLQGMIDGFARLQPDAVRTLESAIELSDDVSFSLELLLEAVGLAFYMADHEQADVLCRRAADFPPTSDFDRLIVAVLTAEYADHVRAAELTAEATEIAERLHDARCLIWVAGAAGRTGDWGDGLPYASRAVQIARERGFLATLPNALQAYASQLVGCARFDLAYAAAEEGWQLARDLGLPWAASWTCADLATIDAIRGDAERVTEHLAQLKRLASSSADLVQAAVGRAQGLLDLGAGRPATALEHLLAAIEVIRHGSSPIMMSGVPDAVEAAVRAQRVDAVLPYYEGFQAWIERFPNPARLALLERCRAMLDDDGDAEAHYRRALDRSAALNPFDQARTELLYGEWLRRGRRRLEARPQLRNAIAAFERLGAAPWTNRARNELRASGETTRRRDASTRDQLTPRELQIAILAADGRTNPDIAAQLFLSPRTIDYHLRKVFAKLDIAPQ